MKLATPYRVLKTQGVVLETPNASEGGKPRGKSPLLDMVFADRAATELANRSGLLLTVNALHVFDIFSAERSHTVRTASCLNRSVHLGLAVGTSYASLSFSIT